MSESQDKRPLSSCAVLMNALRPSALALALMLVSACDSVDSPASAARPSPAESAALALSTESTLLVPEPETTFQAEIQLPKLPEPEPHAQAEPLQPAGQAQPNPVEKPAKPQVPRPRVALKKAPEPSVPLDLSVPTELLKSLQPQGAPAELDHRLLPPMFIEKAGENPFQLNGRLITKDRQDVIEGAELRIQFKR